MELRSKGQTGDRSEETERVKQSRPQTGADTQGFCEFSLGFPSCDVNMETRHLRV